jgi:hypothetical protein
MDTQAAKLDAEERQIRDRLVAIQQELGTLEARLAEIAQQKQRLPPTGGPAALPKSAKPVDPVEVLRRAPRGTALFAIGPDGAASLFVSADADRIDALGADPDIEFRTGVFTPPGTGLALVPILVRIGSDEAENVYESWLNDSPGGFAGVLAALAGQERIALPIYGDGSRLERTLEVQNPFTDFARQILAAHPGAATVSADAVHQAKQVVYKQYPSARALWKALKG